MNIGYTNLRGLDEKGPQFPKKDIFQTMSLCQIGLCGRSCRSQLYRCRVFDGLGNSLLWKSNFFELVQEVKEQGKPIDLICETFLKYCRLANEVFWIVDNLAVFLLIRISHLLWWRSSVLFRRKQRLSIIYYQNFSG